MPLHQQQVGPLIQFTFSHKVPGAAIQTSEVNWFRLEDTLKEFRVVVDDGRYVRASE